MALVKIQHAGGNFIYGDPETMRAAIENAKRVLAQKERQVAQQRSLLARLEAGLLDLEAQVEAEKARKAEQRKAKQTAA